jgi:hypothetical protein
MKEMTDPAFELRVVGLIKNFDLFDEQMSACYRLILYFGLKRYE